MRRMPGTDLWHLTHRVRHDWQGSYHLAPDEGTETVPDPDPRALAQFCRQPGRRPVQPPNPAPVPAAPQVRGRLRPGRAALVAATAGRPGGPHRSGDHRHRARPAPGMAVPAARAPRRGRAIP
ncbi:enterochelin esterase domain-containing protein [Micromonospora aurantiaca]